MAGSRAYVRGDDVRQIDRLASARLSLALERDEFIVRQQFTEEATHVVVVEDVRPSMRLFPGGCPWLSKPAAVAEIRRLLGASAAKARCPFQQLPVAGLAAGLEALLHARLGPGSFVFLVSDFLGPVPEPELCSCATRMLDVVPVVVQDPTWEGSFPVEVGGLVLPLADAAGTRLADVRVTRAEARARRERNEARRAALLARLLELGHEPVLVEDGRPDAVLSAFLGWASGRLAARGRAA